MPSNSSATRDFFTSGYSNNGVTRRESYQIPDIVLHTASIRKVKIITIGAGISGVINCYRFQQELENVEHVVYEKNGGVGGTWYENRYPGCACDLPSHTYTLPFALNPDWSCAYAPAAEIRAYLDEACEVCNLKQYMRFNCEIIGCYWQEAQGQWLVKIKETKLDGSTNIFEDRCDFLISSIGFVNNWKWPDIKGLDTFKGRVIHTAKWDETYTEDQWSNDRVAVIGGGASSIQVVTALQPTVKHLDVFVRSASWFIKFHSSIENNFAYTDEQKKEYHEDARALLEHVKALEDELNGSWGGFFSNSDAQKFMQQYFGNRMAEWLKDERLLKGFRPTYDIGCRRPTPGDAYMLAVQEPNVDVHFTSVTELTEKGVIGKDGIEREVDTVICATGFDTTYRPRFPLVGRNGITLAEKWKDNAEGYLGCMIPEMPNMVITIGPAWPILNGGLMGSLWSNTGMALNLIKKLQTEYVHSICPKQEVADEFNEHIQEWVRHTVWSEDCPSWYKNAQGRVNGVWPGSSLHYTEVLSSPRYEDFDIKYMGPAKQNRFAYLGMGVTKNLVEKRELSAYFGLDRLDPRWVKAKNINQKQALKDEIERLQQQLLCND